MTTTLTGPEDVLAARTIDERHVTEQEAREVAESTRETEWTSPSFLKELFGGNLRLACSIRYAQAGASRTTGPQVEQKGVQEMAVAC